jgi:hypothetical protein
MLTIIYVPRNVRVNYVLMLHSYLLHHNAWNKQYKSDNAQQVRMIHHYENIT